MSSEKSCGRFFERFAPYIEAGEMFAKKQELYQKYGGVSDLVQLLDTYPVSDGGKEEVYIKINEEMSDWLKSNPGASPLAPRFRLILINGLRPADLQGTQAGKKGTGGDSGCSGPCGRRACP